MKVYLLTTGPFPFGTASNSRIKCYAKAIMNAGLEFEVIVFQRTSKYGKDTKSVSIQYNEDNIPYRYSGKQLFGSSSPLIKKYNDWKDKRTLIRYLDKCLKKNDVVIIYFSDVKFSLKTINVSHRRGAYVIKELNELPGKGNPSSSANRIKRQTETKVFPKFDGVICISQALIHYSQKYVSPKCKMIKIPILVDFDKYELADSQDKSSIKYIFHSGSLTERKDGILGMIEAFGRAIQDCHDSIFFYCTGELEKSPHSSQIKSLIDKYHLQDRLFFTGYLSDDELKMKLSNASLCIINKNNTIQNQYCFATKLGEYLAAGKCVIVTNVGEIMNWVDNGKEAIIVEHDNIDAISNAIKMAMSNIDYRKFIGHNGKALALNHFNAQSYSVIFNNYLKTVCGEQ